MSVPFSWIGVVDYPSERAMKHLSRTSVYLIVYLVLGASCQQAELPLDRPSGVTVLVGSRPTVQEATLFPFDNVSIPYTNNLLLEMSQPRKYPENPVFPPGKGRGCGRVRGPVLWLCCTPRREVQDVVCRYWARTLHDSGKGQDVEPSGRHSPAEVASGLRREFRWHTVGTSRSGSGGVQR